MKRTASRLLLLLLLATLTAGPAFARGPEPVRSGKEARSVFSVLWRSLADLLPSLDKTRSTLDPNGSPTPEPPGDETDGRGTIDPNS